MKLTTLLTLALLTAVSPRFATAADCDPGSRLFDVRQYDELVTTDGEKLQGKVNEQDDGSFKVRDLVKSMVRTFPKEMVRIYRKKATAESELARLSEQNAGNASMMFKIACEATTRFNLHKQVIPILERTIATRPDEALKQMLAKLYLDTAQADRALRLAEDLVKAKPNDARSLALRGRALTDLNRLDDAEKDLSKASKLAPGDDQIALAYANLLLRTGRSEAAKKMYAETIMANPRSVAALTGLGLVQLRSADFAAAIQTFGQALELNKDYIGARIGQATAKMLLKQYDEAYGDANLALNIDTNCAEAYEVQAFCRLLKGDPASLADGEKSIKYSLDLKPAQPRLNLAYAVVLDREAKYEELKSDKERDLATVNKLHSAADSKFNEILGSDTPDAYIQYFIGERRFQEARENLRRKEPVAYKTALAKAGDAFQFAAKIEPGYAPVHAAVGATLLELGKFPEAQAAYARAASLDSANAEYLAGQGLALLSNPQQFDEAQELFTKALNLNPANVAACCGRRYNSNWQRNKNHAMSNFQKALAADGDCSYAANALQAIYRQDGDDMDYVRFTGTDWPAGWKSRSPGAIKAYPANGVANFVGVQGPAQGSPIELYRDFVDAGAFRRLEADLSTLPTSAIEFGLHISSGIGPAPAFEVHFGKDASNIIKIKFRDNGGAMPNWAATHAEWPANGRVRLTLEAAQGIRPPESKFVLSVNGKTVAEIAPKLATKIGRLTLGVFLQAPPSEKVNATVNNIVIVRKGDPEGNKNDVSPDVKLIEDKGDKPAPVPAPAPTPTPAPDKPK